MRAVLGINLQSDNWATLHHSGAAALMIDQKFVCAVAEERLTREKHAGSNYSAAMAVLRDCGIPGRDIGHLSAVPFGNFPEPTISHYPGLQAFDDMLPSVKKWLCPSHHFGHALMSYFLSPFERALVIVMDHMGSYLSSTSNLYGLFNREQASYYLASGRRLSLIDRDFEDADAVGFGQGYARFTQRLGLGDYRAAGKTMGLASCIGQSTISGPILWKSAPNGRLASSIKGHEGRHSIDLLFARNGLAIPGTQGKPLWKTDYGIDIAKFVQEQLEDAVVTRIGGLMKLTRTNQVCFAGGVAHNVQLNGAIVNRLGCELFVPDYPSDEGQALAAAIFADLSEGDVGKRKAKERPIYTFNSFLGPLRLREQQSKAVEHLTNSGWRKFGARSVQARIKKCCDILIGDGFLGLFEGRSEFGARALGHRSILADARHSNAKARLNAAKGRELFRPFAPCILAGNVALYFKNVDQNLAQRMLTVAHASEVALDHIPAAIHSDGTARVQIVAPDSEAVWLRRILEHYQAASGIAALINTSFNLANDPIVENAEDAAITAIRMPLSGLLLNGVLWLPK